MPAPGAQHSSAAPTPYEEPKPRINEFTAQEIAILQNRLDKQLGPEYLSSRPGPGNKKIHYIQAEKVIQLANEVFGFNGWSSSIQNMQVDFIEENAQKQVSLGISVIVRVTLRDGTYHEDVGYGSIENCKGKAAAFEKAKKEGTTDALKRALRGFGNALGNCVYDKTYLSNVTRLRPQNTRFDEANLYRHHDYNGGNSHPTIAQKQSSTNLSAPQPAKFATDAGKPPQQPPQRQSRPVENNAPALPPLGGATAEELDLLVAFDDADFCYSEDIHPDEMSVSDTNITIVSQDASLSTPKLNLPPANTNGNSAQSQSNRQPFANIASNASSGQPQTPQQQRPLPHGEAPPQQQQQQQQQPVPARNNDNGQYKPEAPETPVPVGFFSARGVANVLEMKDAPAPEVIPGTIPLFDPKYDSPSIRKTPGIDHNSSKPVGRNLTHVAPPTNKEPAPSEGVLASVASASGGSVAIVKPASAGPAGGFGTPTGFKAPSRLNASIPPGTNKGGATAPQPHVNQPRMIGAPSGASPAANRGHQYRPPMKRQLDQGSTGVVIPSALPAEGRMPLQNVPTNTGLGHSATVHDTKRLKTE